MVDIELQLLDALAGTIADFFHANGFIMINWSRIANQLGITNPGDHHQIRAGFSRWNSYKGVLSLYFQKSHNTGEQIEKLIDALKSFNCSKTADKIRKLKIVTDILGPVNDRVNPVVVERVTAVVAPLHTEPDESSDVSDMLL